MGRDGSLTQISNTALEAVPNVAAHIQVGNAMYFNLADPATGNHQIFYNTSDQGRGGYSTHLNESGGGIVVSEWIEFDGALYFRAAPVDPLTAELGFNAGIFRLDGPTGTPVRITNEGAGGDPTGFFGPRVVGGRLTYAANDPIEIVAPGQFAFDVYALETGPTGPVRITESELVGSNYPNAPTVVLGNSSYFVAVDKNDRVTPALQTDGAGRSRGHVARKAYINQRNSRLRHGRR